jgi:hypothetical protein
MIEFGLSPDGDMGKYWRISGTWNIVIPDQRSRHFGNSRLCWWRLMREPPLISWNEEPACLQTIGFYCFNSALKYRASTRFFFSHSPSFALFCHIQEWQIDMSGSAVADIRATYGIAFIGLLLSTVYVSTLFLLIPLLIWSTRSLYGVTITQTWVEVSFFQAVDLSQETWFIQMDLLLVTNSRR